jgi:hypothetical protein
MRFKYLGVLVVAAALPAAVAAASVSQSKVAPEKWSLRNCRRRLALRGRSFQASSVCRIIKRSSSCRGTRSRRCSVSPAGMAKRSASLESADQLGVQKFFDPKAIEPLLTPQQRELLGAFGIDLSKVDIAKAMRLLGVDLSQIDLPKLKQQCRESQGELDRFATRELNRVEEQLFRCDDRV